jgi:hypothetical protein
MNIVKSGLVALLALLSIGATTMPVQSQEVSPTVVLRITAETQALRCSTCRIYAQPGTILSFNKSTGLRVIRGRAIVRASEPLKVRTAVAEFTADENKIIAVETFKTRTRIHALNDSVLISTAKGEKKVDCGRQLLISTEAAPQYSITRFSMFALLKHHPCARMLRSETDLQAHEMMDELLKTCAALECLRQSAGV